MSHYTPSPQGGAGLSSYFNILIFYKNYLYTVISHKRLISLKYCVNILAVADSLPPGGVGTRVVSHDLFKMDTQSAKDIKAFST